MKKYLLHIVFLSLILTALTNAEQDWKAGTVIEVTKTTITVHTKDGDFRVQKDSGEFGLPGIPLDAEVVKRGNAIRFRGPDPDIEKVTGVAGHKCSAE